MGTIIVAHGGSPQWNAEVLAVAADAETGGPVQVSFLMGEGARAYRFQDVVGSMVDAGVASVVVVPLLVSSHSGHYQQLRYLVGDSDSLSPGMRQHLTMAGVERPSVDVPLILTPAMDDAPEVARVLADRALALAAEPSAQALFIVGHGPNSAENYAAWMANVRRLVGGVEAATRFRDVKVGLVRDDAPSPVREEAVRRVREMIQLQYRLTGREVVVVPLFVSRGRLTREKIPADLTGLSIAYSGEPLLPHPDLARWIEARVRQAAALADSL